MLVKVAPVAPPKIFGHYAEGMDANSPLAPGQPPPWLSPHCLDCRLPVEWFTPKWASSPFFLDVEMGCCGRTWGLRIPASEVLHKSKHGGAIWTRCPRPRSNHAR